MGLGSTFASEFIEPGGYVCLFVRAPEPLTLISLVSPWPLKPLCLPEKVTFLNPCFCLQSLSLDVAQGSRIRIIVPIWQMKKLARRGKGTSLTLLGRLGFGQRSLASPLVCEHTPSVLAFSLVRTLLREQAWFHE